jgi:hypothetical protein
MEPKTDNIQQQVFQLYFKKHLVFMLPYRIRCIECRPRDAKRNYEVR